MMVGMSLCPSTTIALFCNANARRHNFSSLTGVAPGCGADVWTFGDLASPLRESGKDASEAETRRQKRMKTRGNLFIIGSYFSSECYGRGAWDYKIARWSGQ